MACRHFTIDQYSRRREDEREKINCDVKKYDDDDDRFFLYDEHDVSFLEEKWGKNMFKKSFQVLEGSWKKGRVVKNASLY